MSPPLRSTMFNFTWSNDGLNLMAPASDLQAGRRFYDDDGFTNDLAASVALLRDSQQLSLSVRHRMITERGGLRRADEMHALARFEKTLREDRCHELRLLVGAGAMLTGPLGGAQLQDRFHRLIQWGRTLNGDLLGQLQNDYEGGVRAAPRLELGFSDRRKLSQKWQAHWGAEVAYSPGVGASAAQLSVGIERRWRAPGGEFKIMATLPLRYLHSEEDRLTFPGGYPESEVFLQPSPGVSYRYGAAMLAFDLALNVEGSGAHQGELSFSYYFGGS